MAAHEIFRLSLLLPIDWSLLFQGVLIGASVLAGLRGCNSDSGSGRERTSCPESASKDRTRADSPSDSSLNPVKNELDTRQFSGSSTWSSCGEIHCSTETRRRPEERTFTNRGVVSSSSSPQQSVNVPPVSTRSLNMANLDGILRVDQGNGSGSEGSDDLICIPGFRSQVAEDRGPALLPIAKLRLQTRYM